MNNAYISSMLRSMLRRAILFIKGEWKRLGALLLIMLGLYALFSYLGYLSDPERPQICPDLPCFLTDALHFALENTVVFYLLIYHIAIPLLRDRKLARFFLLLALLFVLKFGLDFLLDYPPPTDDQEGGLIAGSIFLTFLLEHVFVNLIVICASFAFALLMEWNKKSKQQEELEKQMVIAELSAIKYQINPHFLFNSLNFIYSKTVPLSDEVANAVLLLSEIMRYALGKEDEADGKVLLSRELAHMKNVITINQMRFNRRLNIQYNENVDNPSAKITPLILITLVENAFKHGDLSDPANPLILQIDADNSSLHVYICNKKKNGPRELSTGIGLNNIRQRLQLTYGGMHDLVIKDEGRFYITELRIKF